MEYQKCDCGIRDIGCDNRTQRLVVWQIPYLILLIAIGVYWLYSELAGWLWSAGFSWLGIACLSNAFYCKRKHCFFTGPLYLTLGVLAVLSNLNILTIGWGYIWLIFLLGTILSYIPEWRGSKYFQLSNPK